MGYFDSHDGVRLHYTDTGNRDSSVVVLCLAGLTRNGADFDYVAPVFEDCRMLTMDYRGRGKSSWADERSYTIPIEAQDALALLDHLGIARAAILGTSRGGLIAMFLAATAKDRLTGVALNDIGPVIEQGGLEHIASFLGLPPPFATIEEAAAALARSEGFMGVSQERWIQEAQKRFIEVSSGGLALAYDPRLREAVLNTGLHPQIDIWPFFDALAGLPLALIRGENSNLLSQQTASQMAERRADMVLAEVAGRAHVPFLDEPEATRALGLWLEALR